MAHFLNLIDHTPVEVRQLVRDAALLKAERRAGKVNTALAGKVIGLVFEKPSLRTRVSFQAGIAQLGGTSLFFPGNEIGLGWRETLEDFARTMSRFVEAIVLRVYKHETLDALANAGSVPIINGLSDLSHPCQALADLLTIQECFGEMQGKTIAFIGDGNNVSRSLAVGCAMVGAKFVLACPEGYEFDAPFLKRFTDKFGNANPLVTFHDPAKAVRNADVIYTDVWTSMGQEAEREERLQKFSRFQVNEALIAKAPKHCRVLHCLPAHRGEEITDGVVDGPQSAVFDQAENRLHVQKAVMVKLLGK